MGATQSAQPSPEELDNLALYPDEVVAALRACFGALATDDGVILASAFLPPQLPAEGARWSKLYQLMCELDEPSSSDGPLHWPGFLAGITRYCKAPKSQRARTLVGAYADGGAGLSDDALRVLLRDAQSAARAGDDGGGATVPSWGFDGVLADVHRAGSGAVSREEGKNCCCWRSSRPAQTPQVVSLIGVWQRAQMGKMPAVLEAKPVPPTRW